MNSCPHDLERHQVSLQASSSTGLSWGRRAYKVLKNRAQVPIGPVRKIWTVKGSRTRKEQLFIISLPHVEHKNAFVMVSWAGEKFPTVEECRGRNQYWEHSTFFIACFKVSKVRKISCACAPPLSDPFVFFDRKSMFVNRKVDTCMEAKHPGVRAYSTEYIVRSTQYTYMLVASGNTNKKRFSKENSSYKYYIVREKGKKQAKT